MKILTLLLSIFISAAGRSAEMTSEGAQLIQVDLRYQLSQVVKPETNIRIDFRYAQKTQTQLLCRKNEMALIVSAPTEEQSSAAYAALRDMGFLFPHPRKRLLPSTAQVMKFCGKTFSWSPRLKDRGFHIHLQHPSEWVDGFLMDHGQIATDLMWWLVHNQQNVLQIQMIQMPDQQIVEKLNPLVQDARRLGLNVGLSFSFAMIQQHSFRLIPAWRDILDIGTVESLKTRLEQIATMVPMDFMAFELGSSEFTSSKEPRTIAWMNAAAEVMAKHGAKVMMKSHSSSNQVSLKYGNFNFLPKYAEDNVGTEPHTVYFYSLQDELAPMYGRKSFIDMKDYLLAQSKVRPTWYFPETSYWVGMDQDIPIFLTDYLIARTEDVDFLQENHVTGQVDFTTGQELGSWLFDWQVALLADSRSRGKPMYALELLGEDLTLWQSILDWQHEYFKKRQIVQMISSSNLMDEFSPLLAKIHERQLIRELWAEPATNHAQIQLLEEALARAPSFQGVRDPELCAMLEITKLRIAHALELRYAIADRQNGSSAEVHLTKAAHLRERAQLLMDQAILHFNRYPESWIYQVHDNPTSYPYGYLWPAANLHFWKREEAQVRDHIRNPFFMNIYNPLRLLF